MELDDMKYARCKACDTAFYPVWIPQREGFEELCHVCKPIAIKAAFMLEDEDDNFLEGYLIDKRGESWTE